MNIDCFGVPQRALVRGRRIVLSTVMAAPFLAVPLFFISATPAAADNGFCGVRHDEFYAGSGVFDYEVRNKCSAGWTFKVYLPQYGHYAVGTKNGKICEYNPGHNTITRYSAPVRDDDWIVRAC